MVADEKIDCEKEYVNIINTGDALNISNKIDRMEIISRVCGGSGIFEARLAKLYSILGKHDRALNILNDALKKDIPHKKELKLALFDTLFAQENTDKAEKVALQLISEYPDWDGGYLSMGRVSLVLNKNSEAIDYLEKAITKDQIADTYLLMVMAYYGERRYRESALAMQKALKLNQNSLANTQAVCGAAYSLVALEYLEEAKDLLVRHAEFVPDAKNDITYKETLALVDKALKH